MVGLVLGGLDWFGFGERERRVIAWGVTAGPEK